MTLNNDYTLSPHSHNAKCAKYSVLIQNHVITISRQSHSDYFYFSTKIFNIRKHTLKYTQSTWLCNNCRTFPLKWYQSIGKYIFTARINPGVMLWLLSSEGAMGDKEVYPTVTKCSINSMTWSKQCKMNKNIISSKSDIKDTTKPRAGNASEPEEKMMSPWKCVREQQFLASEYSWGI